MAKKQTGTKKRTATKKRTEHKKRTETKKTSTKKQTEKKTTKSVTVSKANAKVKPPSARAAAKKPALAKTKHAPASKASEGKPASQLIDQRIRDLGGWRGETLARMRALILVAEPEAIEEWKWMGTPVWSRHGIICTGEAYTKVVKLTFARGAKVPDPFRLFNSSLEGNMRRAIDIHEGEKVDVGAFETLVKAAVALNGSTVKKR